MAFYTNVMADLLGIYDAELSVWHYKPGNNGKVLGRNSLQNVHHSGGNPEEHPTLTNVIRNTNGHVFLNGSFDCEWSWEPGEVSEAEIDAYLALVEPVRGAVITKDMANNRLLMSISDPNMLYPDWTTQNLEWHPKAPNSKITMASNDAEFLCVTRLNGTYSQYAFEQRSIEPGESLVIERPASDVCYVLFTDHVLKGQGVLIGKKMYKMTSQSLTVTNNNPNRIRVLRYYR